MFKMVFSQILKSCRSKIQQELQKLTKTLQKSLILKTYNFHSKLEIYTKSKKVFRYENKEKHPIYVSKKCCEGKNVDLLSIEEKGKRHYVFIKNTLMYTNTLHHGKKQFCC